jgi:dienelactone hydrolase
MRFANKWLVLSLLSLLPMAACTPNNQDSIDEGGSTTLKFEVGASDVENHVFPTDTYQDRSFVFSPSGLPLLATPTSQAGLDAAVGGTGALIGTDDGGFPAAMAASASYLVNYGLTGRGAYSSTTQLYLPFDNSNELSLLNPETVQNTSSIRIFEIGIPQYLVTAAPPAPVGPPTFVNENDTPVTAIDSAREVPVGELAFNPSANTIAIRPSIPFRPAPVSAANPRNPRGYRTFAVVVIDDGSLRTRRNGPVAASRFYSAIRNGDITGLTATEQANATRYLNDTSIGFGLVQTFLRTNLNNPTFGRANTLAYFQFTVRNDTTSLQMLRSIINGNTAVDRTAIGGGASDTVGLTGPINGDIGVAPIDGFDGIPSNGDEPIVLEGPTTISAVFAGAPAAAIARAVVGSFATPNFNAPNFLAISPAPGAIGVANPAQPLTSGVPFNRRFLGAAAAQVAATLTGDPSADYQLVLAGAVVPFGPGNNLRQWPPVDGTGVLASADPAVAAKFNAILNPSNTVTPFNSLIIPYTLFIPIVAPAGGGTNYPVVIVQHGFTRSRNDAIAIANTLCSTGLAVLAIDAYQHGDRQAFEGGNTTKLDEIAGSQGLPDPFLNPLAAPRTSDKILATLSSQLCAVRALVANQAFDPSVTAPPAQITPTTFSIDTTRIYYIGLSLGGILGTSLTAVEDNIQRAVLNVPGGSLESIAARSGEIAPQLDGAVLALSSQILGIQTKAVSKFSAVRDVFDLSVGHFLAEVDPLTFAPNLLSPAVATDADKSSLRTSNFQPAVLVQYVSNDTVVPNSTNARLARAIALGDPVFTDIAISNTVIMVNGNAVTRSFPVLFPAAARTVVTASPTSPLLQNGVTFFPILHGGLFDPSFSLEGTIAEQTQATTFTITGAIR